MVSSFFRSSNVTSGVECTVESESADAHRTNQHVIRLTRLPTHHPSDLTDSSISGDLVSSVTNELISSSNLRPMSGTSAFSAG